MLCSESLQGPEGLSCRVTSILGSRSYFLLPSSFSSSWQIWKVFREMVVPSSLKLNLDWIHTKVHPISELSLFHVRQDYRITKTSEFLSKSFRSSILQGKVTGTTTTAETKVPPEVCSRIEETSWLEEVGSIEMGIVLFKKSQRKFIPIFLLNVWM